MLDAIKMLKGKSLVFPQLIIIILVINTKIETNILSECNQYKMYKNFPKESLKKFDKKKSDRIHLN